MSLILFSFCVLHTVSVRQRDPAVGTLGETALRERSEGFRFHHRHETHVGAVYPDKWLNDAIFHNRTSGFYVEVGVLCPTACSTGAFFDLELCWSGICIDGQASSYETTGALHRTCDSMNGILCPGNQTSDISLEISGGGEGYSGLENSLILEHRELVKKKEENGEWRTQRKRVRCVDIVAEVKRKGRHRVDLLIMDVEGAEIVLLQQDSLFDIKIDTIIVETDQPDKLESLLVRRAYTKVGQVGYDYVFSCRNAMLLPM